VLTYAKADVEYESTDYKYHQAADVGDKEVMAQGGLK